MIIHDLSVDTAAPRVTKGAVNADTIQGEIHRGLPDTKPPAKHNRETERAVPNHHILLAKADVSRCVKTYVSLELAHELCYVLKDVLVGDLRLIFGWAASPGNWSALGSAIEHVVHGHIVIDDMSLLSEGIKMKARVKIL